MENDMQEENIFKGTAQEFTDTNPVLPVGAIGIESDTYKKKMGDGATAWNLLEYI